MTTKSLPIPRSAKANQEVDLNLATNWVTEINELTHLEITGFNQEIEMQAIGKQNVQIYRSIDDMVNN